MVGGILNPPVPRNDHIPPHGDLQWSLMVEVMVYHQLIPWRTVLEKIRVKGFWLREILLWSLRVWWYTMNFSAIFPAII